MGHRYASWSGSRGSEACSVSTGPTGEVARDQLFDGFSPPFSAERALVLNGVTGEISGMAFVIFAGDWRNACACAFRAVISGSNFPWLVFYGSKSSGNRCQTGCCLTVNDTCDTIN